MSAKITRSILEHCGDIIHALVTGAAAEPDLEVALAEGQRRHVDGAAQGRRPAAGAGRPRRVRRRRRAVETLAAMSDFRFALMLRDSYGWSLDRIESWIAATSQALLLRSK